MALFESMTSFDGNLYLSEVDYINHKEDNFSIDHPLAPFLHKSKYFDYENEVRVVRYNSTSDIFSDRADFGSPVGVDLSRLINSVKVSPLAPSWFYDLVSNLVNKRYGISAPVVYSGLKDAPIYNLGWR